MPLRAIRQRLRLIRYYSANRPYDRWSRTLDIALVGALVAAWPAAWVLDGAYVRAGEPFVISGNLYEDPDERVWAWTPPPPDPPEDVRGDATFYGAFRIEVRGEDRGWPFVTSHRPRRLNSNVNVFETNTSAAASELPADAPARRAIDAILAESVGDRFAAAVWSGSLIEPAYRARGWIANGLVLTVLLVIAAWLTVSLLRLASLFHVAERQQRAEVLRREARCSACGYDLQGNLFSERCPECGAVV